MSVLAKVCATCGLRIQETTVGWQHLGTVAGREASADHPATPKGLSKDGGKR